jgi:ABC-type multidrug transport system fused ATPase/permease subunit
MFVIAGALVSLIEVRALRVIQGCFPPPLPPVEAEAAEPATKAAAAKKAAESAVRWRKMALVLKPYFLPEGLQHRLLVAVTWACLLASKLANLWAPLYLGSAIQQLSESKTLPLAEIVLYSGLMLANKLFKELQTIAYIKVKQTAYRELARTTFAHLHALSLEWHLQKKMGEVLRAMDRGVSAADNMVSYLFLYLLPAVAECIVTFIIFYAHFQIVGLASIAFLSFVLYIPQLTRTPSNR